MNVDLKGDDLHSIHDELTMAQLACTRLVSSAKMLRDGVLIPNWETDVLEPAMRICAALVFVADTLPKDPEEGSEPS